MEHFSALLPDATSVITHWVVELSVELLETLFEALSSAAWLFCMTSVASKNNCKDKKRTYSFITKLITTTMELSKSLVDELAW